MKKIFIVCAAVALLASCSKNDSMSYLATENDNAISFEALAQTAITKGKVMRVDSFRDKGIGVFAFYQPASNVNFTTSKYPTPDFMYNQQIKYSNSGWSYTPVKYWPNTDGDKLSFFAYSPYESTTSWEDLGIKTNSVGTSITKTFDIANEVENQIDYLFANPVLNVSKPTSITYTGGDSSGIAAQSSIKTMASGDDVIKFPFKHVMSKINIFIGVSQNKNTTNPSSVTSFNNNEVTAWTDTNTVINIKSIEFKDLAQQMIYTISVDGSTVSDPDSSFEGSQDILVKPSDAVKTIKCDNPSYPTWKAGWHRYMDTSSTSDTIGAKTDASKNEYMFIAPEDVSKKDIVITYEVVTTSKADPDNNFTNTNVITKKWGDFTGKFTSLKSGYQYNLYFLIGMQGVKVAATITDWGDESSHYEYVPEPNGD